ncbi:hypothetical protein EEW87_17615 (plasmid) [Janibacter melonis]|uniref:Uncharacterized protein n=1 Tax=Janibacter melonis TaxID=262209 RepID=A0A650GER0_9MICO|nr:hypothetical protein [Janibacter melonis]MCB5993205.1 hypothetical protein [Janibacter melonis]QGX08823.1 hypothetical protein EEW87_17615 [Janibacter melonis]
MMYAGEEELAHGDQHPEVYDDQGEDGGDPLDLPCEECGAEAGEECRPYCTAMP